jgi:hypothetical protein
MAKPIDCQELKRREYELKRHDFLARISDLHYAIAMRLAMLALTGNLVALVAVWTSFKDRPHDEWMKHMFSSVWDFTWAMVFAICSLAFYFVATGALSTIWRNAGIRHFDPGADAAKPDEKLNRKVNHIASRMGDVSLIASETWFSIGCYNAIYYASMIFK